MDLVKFCVNVLTYLHRSIEVSWSSSRHLNGTRKTNMYRSIGKYKANRNQNKACGVTSHLICVYTFYTCLNTLFYTSLLHALMYTCLGVIQKVRSSCRRWGGGGGKKAKRRGGGVKPIVTFGG